jgi:C4-dicarboxylate-specific signal transduction histidine kinase
MKPAAAAAHAVQIKKPEVRSDLDTRANRYDILSRLADDLAHEIKNPLNAIVVNLEVLRRKIETGAAQVAIERAYVVDQEITRVHTMVDQLLQLMRPGGAESKTVSVDETIEELRSVLVAQAKATRVKLEIRNEAGCFVRASRETLKFAVLNLIVGVYEVASLQQIMIETVGSGASAEIVIRSTPAAFDEAGEFVRHARAWIEMAGGTLEIAELSADNIGSTSTLRLPACSSFA